MSTTRLLYPADTFLPKQVDEVYVDEAAAAVAAGFSVSIFNFEDFQAGELRIRPAPQVGEVLLYRGWMLTEAEYQRLHGTVLSLGATMVTRPEEYILCHHLPRWLPLFQEFTAETRCYSEHDDIQADLAAAVWQGCFLKDYVKSLSTDGGSLVTDLSAIPQVLAAMKKYRGHIEGGVCARRLEEYDTATERRFFVCRGISYGDGEAIPEPVRAAAERVRSPFFTVDVARRSDGVLRIIELGDGQVSDRKHWSCPALISVLPRLECHY